MGKIAQIAEKLSSLYEAQLEAALLTIIQKHSAEIIDLELFQLRAGITNKGTEVQPPYQSESYAEFKKTLNPAGVVDLKLTGAFWEGFFMKADKFPITFGSTDEKTPELVEKYGEDIFGVYDKNAIKQIILQEYQQYQRSLLKV